jgi:hypothetical protein
MAEHAAWMRHPDGGVPLLNDSALHAEHTIDQSSRWANRLGVKIDTRPRRGGQYFPDSGVAIWQGSTWTLFFDVGPLGPDYQPGHGHADTLSFECSYRGSRIFVDPGTYGYDRDDRRRYDRSTQAHNTVCIDEQDSSEVWDIFRVGRRAYPRDVSVEFSDDGMNASSTHTGYDHLPGRPRHHRTITVSERNGLSVVDRVTGNGSHRIEGGFLLASDWEATLEDSGWKLTNGAYKLHVRVQAPVAITLGLQRQPYHPQFGCELETFRLSWETRSNLPIEVKIHIDQG